MRARSRTRSVHMQHVNGPNHLYHWLLPANKYMHAYKYTYGVVLFFEYSQVFEYSRLDSERMKDFY